MESADGHELRFAVNYLAPYLLTHLLLPLLERSAPARIVNVASAGQMPIDFGDVMLRDDYSGGAPTARASSPRSSSRSTWPSELDPARVTVTALHPATFMPTKMVPRPATTRSARWRRASRRRCASRSTPGSRA